MLGLYSVYIANILSLMLLARLFTPEAFGIVTAISVFVAFFKLLAEAGLGPALINQGELTPNDRNGLFGLTIIIGCLLTVMFFTLSRSLVLFYEMPRITEVVPYVAFSLFFYAVSIVPNALLLREQFFYRIANANLVAEVTSTISSIILLTLVDPIHALAAKIAISAVTSFLLIWHFSSQTKVGRPNPGRKLSAIRPMLAFSGYQFGFSFVSYFSRNLDTILIGKHMGPGILGVYDHAFKLMGYPILILAHAMTPAIQPFIKKYSNDADEVESIHRDFTFKISILGAIAGLAMYVLADWIVLILLGDQWDEVIPIIRVLALAIPVQVVLSTSGSFFLGMGRPDLMFVCGVVSAVITVSAIVLGIYKDDVILLCWYLVAAFHINFFQAYFLMYKSVFQTSVRHFFSRMIPASLIVTMMSIYSLCTSGITLLK
jgi:O-antigen/teichoic acid export membrane protein